MIDHIMQKMVKTGKNRKSTNNQMSSFRLIEENMELYHIGLAVNWNVQLLYIFAMFNYLKRILWMA